MNQDKISGKDRHYDLFIADDLISGPTATNADPNAQLNQLTFETLKRVMKTFDLHFSGWKKFRDTLTSEEMAKQVELYRNIIETKYGVKLCVKTNPNSDMITMELLVPQKLFADDGGRENLADALQNIAMFIMNMENPSL